MSIPSPSPSPIPLVPPPTPGDDFVSSDTAIKNKDPNTSPQPGLGAPQQQPRSGEIKDEWMHSVDKLHGELKQLREEMSQLLLDIKKIIGDHDLEKQFEPVAAALDKFTGDIGELSRSLDKTGEVIRKVDLGGLDDVAKQKAEQVLGRVKNVLSRSNVSGLASLSHNSQPTLSSSPAQRKSSPAPKRRQQVDNAQLLDRIKQLQDQVARDKKVSQEWVKASEEKISKGIRNNRKLKKEINDLKAQLQKKRLSDVEQPKQPEQMDPATQPSSTSEMPTGTEVGKFQPKTESDNSDIDDAIEKNENDFNKLINHIKNHDLNIVDYNDKNLSGMVIPEKIDEGSLNLPGENTGNNAKLDEEGAGKLTDEASGTQQISLTGNNSVVENINQAVTSGGN